MTRAGMLCLSIALIAASTGTVAGQAPPGQPATRTASLSGRVIDRASGAPVAHALVLVVGADVSLARATSTDAEGRFAFASLPVGRVLVSAGKAPYLSATYDAPPGRPGRIVSLAAGRPVADLTLALVRGATVAGRALDDGGRPLAGARVRVLQRREVGGELVLNGDFGDPANAQTDDRGEYRVFGLTPGDYVVLVQPRPTPAGSLVEPGAPPRVHQALYVGDTASPRQATRITLAPGEERTGLDVRMPLVPLVRVEGIVATDTGPAPRAVQMLLRPRNTDATGIVAATFATTASPDGRFSLNGVPPGTYDLVARTQPMTLWAVERVDVTTQHISNLQVRLRAGLAIRGRVVVPGLDRLPGDLPAVRIGVRPTFVTGPANAIEPVPLDADGRFTIGGLWPGNYRLFVQVPGNPVTQVPDWFAATALIEGRDVLDTPFVMPDDGRVPEVVVTLIDDTPEIAGTLRDAQGNAVRDATVVVFPVDRQLWFPQSRRIVQRQTGADGLFVFGLAAGLPPGEYFLAASPSGRPGDQFDPWFFEDLAASAVRVTLGAHESKTMDLRLRK